MKIISKENKHFGYELEKLIRRFRYEYDCTYAEMMGALFHAANMLSLEAFEVQKEEDDDDPAI